MQLAGAGGGEMHDDLRKSEKDSTLEHSLFAAFNAEWWWHGGSAAGRKG